MTPIQESDLERLNAYLEGELDSSARERLEAELEARPELRAELEALQQTVALFSSAPEPEPPRDFDRAVQRRIRRRSRGRYFAADVRRERLTQVMIPLAALVVLAFVAVLLDPGRLEVLLEEPPDAQAPEEPAGEDGAGQPDAPTEPPAPARQPTTVPAPADAEPIGPDVRRIEFRYTLHAHMPPESLERALRQRFGASALREPGESDAAPPGFVLFELQVDRARLGQALQRLEDLGRLERSRVEVADVQRQVSVRILAPLEN